MMEAFWKDLFLLNEVPIQSKNHFQIFNHKFLKVLGYSFKSEKFPQNCASTFFHFAHKDTFLQYQILKSKKVGNPRKKPWIISHTVLIPHHKNFIFYYNIHWKQQKKSTFLLEK